MIQTRRRQLSSRDRRLAILGILGVVALLAFLYRPVGPRGQFEDLAELSPLPDSFSVYQDEDWGDRAELYRAGQYQRFGVATTSESLDPSEGELLYLGSAQLLAGQLSDAVYTLRRLLGAEDSLLVAEARWQLAQAYLASEEAEPARDELLHLAERRGHRTFAARQKLGILETRLPKTSGSK